MMQNHPAFPQMPTDIHGHAFLQLKKHTWAPGTHILYFAEKEVLPYILIKDF
jgi:hypothetical protein